MSVIWNGTPPFPESDLNPGMKRFRVGPLWVDYDDGAASQAAVAAWVAAQQTAKSVADSLATTDASAIAAAKADATVVFLMTHTPAEITAYVTTNAINLSTAVALLGKLAVAVSVLGKQSLR